MIGNLIGPYRVERQLAASELSTVYAARHEGTGRRVAIKVARLSEDEAARGLFATFFDLEISLLASLKQSAIPEVLEHGMLPDGAPYFVTEWMDGRDLSAVLDEQGKLPLRSALRVARQVAGALGAAHAVGYIHRDVKPANVLLLDRMAEPWTIKLLDFGVAAKLQEDTGKTQAGNFVGSLRYMSPEQIRSEPLSASSDIWQLGVTLLEMLTGNVPFDEEKTVTTITVIMNAEVRIPAELPGPVRAFLLRCLAKDPSERPADGNAALRELLQLEAETAQEGEMEWAMPSAPMAAPPPGIQAMPMPCAPAPPQHSHPEARVARARLPGRRMLLGLVGAGAVVLAVGFVILRVASVSGAVLSGPSHWMGPGAWGGVGLGIALVLAGVVCGAALQRVLAERRGTITAHAHDLLAGARSRDHLSQTLAIQVDDLAARCRLVDEKFLAMTMAVMVDEYGASTTFDDRQKALMNAVTLLEKLMAKLSPWYVRHDKLVALMVTLVGVLSGLATVAQSVAKLMKGT